MNKHQPTQMSKAARAALFSAFIFPGAGLWWLGSRARACVFILPTALLLVYFIKLLWQLMAPIQKKIQRQVEQGLIDPFDLLGLYARLYKEIFLALEPYQAQLEFAQYTLIACWLCSIVSSYFVGKKLDIPAKE
jgi:hypothetical protein